jgi:hypothetical protein
MRAGGLVEDNIFARAPVLLMVGGGSVPLPGGVTGVVRRNVFIEAGDYHPLSIIGATAYRGNGLRLENIASLEASDNLFVNDRSQAGVVVLLNGANCGDNNQPCPVSNVTLTRNVAINWDGAVEQRGTVAGLKQIDNDWTSKAPVPAYGIRAWAVQAAAGTFDAPAVSRALRAQ